MNRFGGALLCLAMQGTPAWADMPVKVAELAPGKIELDQALERLDEAVWEAEVARRSIARLQNEWSKNPPGPCRRKHDSMRLAQIRAFGKAYRDAVQMARIRSQKVAQFMDSPTLQPILDERTYNRADDLFRRVRREEASAIEIASWSKQYVEYSYGWCESELLPIAGVRHHDDGGRPVAAIGVGGGVICPLDTPADGRLVILPDGLACYSFEACDCQPLPVSIGEVIGPAMGPR